MCASRTFTNIKITYFLNKRELEYRRGIQTEIYYRREEETKRNHREANKCMQNMYGLHTCVNTPGFCEVKILFSLDPKQKKITLATITLVHQESFYK